jgi:hypothetical protein
MFTYRGDKPLTIKGPKVGILTLNKGSKLERLDHPRLKACFACGLIKEDPVIAKSSPVKATVAKKVETKEETTKQKKYKKNKKKEGVDG